MRAATKISTTLGLATAAALAVGIVASAAQASTATSVPPKASPALVGTWVNTNGATNSVKKVILTPNRVGSVNVDAFGACVPTLCEWGSVPAITYGASVSSTIGTAFQTRQAFLSGGKEWSRTTLFGRLVSTRDGLRLALREMTVFEDGSGRKNYVRNETFKLGTASKPTKAGVSVSGYALGLRPNLTSGAFGTWKPTVPSGNLAKLVISGTAAAPAVHAYGQCSPTPCDLGVVRGITHGATISSTTGATVLAPYVFSFKKEQLVIVYSRDPLTKAEKLTVSEFSEFTDGSGRSNYTKIETLVRV